MEAGYVFDSYALLALFQKEDSAEFVSGILRKTYQRGLRRMISVINVGELAVSHLVRIEWLRS